MNIEQQIIETILRNRISTTEVADCLGKTGAVAGVSILNHGQFRVGPVRYVYAWNKSNWEFHEQIEAVQPGEVIIVEAIECGEHAVFGSLVAKFLLLYRAAAAIVVKGLVRDAHTLRKENYAIWSAGVTPIGCFNRENETAPDATKVAEHHALYDGTIAVCDDSGVVIIPRETKTEDFLEKLRLMELQEDAWFHSIDTDKFTTFETVCLKKYLGAGSVFNKYDELKKSVGNA